MQKSCLYSFTKEEDLWNLGCSLPNTKEGVHQKYYHNEDLLPNWEYSLAAKSTPYLTYIYDAGWLKLSKVALFVKHSLKITETELMIPSLHCSYTKSICRNIIMELTEILIQT